MSKAQWVKYKDGGGPRVRGTRKYNPYAPLGPWEKVLGVVARCEGSHDTVVMYDETGVTWGFMQWTFTSGRLQKLLESFKSIPNYDFTTEQECVHSTLFEIVCCDDWGDQLFCPFGFEIRGGKFVDLRTGDALDPRKKPQKKRIADICMGRVAHLGNIKKQRAYAMDLANLFAGMGQVFWVTEAQIHFAKQEFKRQMTFKRKPLGGKTIEWLFNVKDPQTWELPLAALFWNLWQNNPGAAYKLFLKARKQVMSAPGPEHRAQRDYFDAAWKLLNKSTFGNWGWKPGSKSPRVVRIKKAIEEFYGKDVVDLRYYK